MTQTHLLHRPRTDLSAKDAARELAISENTVKRLFRAGVLRSYRAGKLWRTTHPWIEAFRETGGGKS